MHEKESAPIDPIDFTSLHEQSKNQTTHQEKKQTPSTKIWLLFILLIFCGLAVFFLLPDYVAEQRNNELITDNSINDTAKRKTAKKKPNLDEVTKQKPSEPETEKLSAKQLNELKLQAEDLLLQIIEKQESLQQQAVTKWANEEFRRSQDLGTTGDEHFRKQDYQAAIQAYQETVNLLNKLELQVAPTLAKHLEQGELALTQAEQSTAVLHFEMALAIDKNNQQASIGLQRSETIIELFSLLERGGNTEAANRLQGALQIYHQAKELDSYSEEAKTAYDRVYANLNEQKFTQLISTAYKYLKTQQYANAKDSFLQAKKLQPDSEKVKQGLIKVSHAIRQDKISALRSEALHFESNEEWDYAMESYQQIIALAPNTNFAIDGLSNAQKRFDYLNKLDTYLNDVLRLSTTQVADEANALLAEISNLDKPGDKIAQRAAQLRLQLIRASQPISITLKSDNLTDIVVYKIAKFGKFKNKQLQLKPGKYTLVGSRPGYRDVRKVLLVTADMQEKVFTVHCVEQI